MGETLTRWCRATVVLTGIAGCGSVESRAGLNRCYSPEGSYALCIETVSHRRSAGDLLRRSPGITGRVYGRAQGHDVLLSTVKGGPEYPPHWHELYGRPDCYERGIDFPAVIEAIRDDQVEGDLERHKTFMLDEVEDLARRDIPYPGPAATCEGVTLANMVRADTSSILRTHAAPVLNRSATLMSARASTEGAAAHGLLADTVSDAWEQRCIRCLAREERPRICIEVASHPHDGSQNAAVLRITSGRDPAVTLLIDAPSATVPPGWLVASDTFATHMDNFDADWLIAELSDANDADDAPFLSRARDLAARTRVTADRAGEALLADSRSAPPDDADLDTLDDETQRGLPAEGRFYGSGSGGRTANRGFRSKQGAAGEQYTEAVDVYAAPFIGLGAHSGTVTHVFRWAGNHWERHFRERTCNHGACPITDREMKFRYRCEPGVVTDGWFGFDGECNGRWGPASGDHYCNDDTALQINNAFGRWTDDFCAAPHRKHTPQCRISW